MVRVPVVVLGAGVVTGVVEVGVEVRVGWTGSAHPRAAARAGSRYLLFWLDLRAGEMSLPRRGGVAESLKRVSLPLPCKLRKVFDPETLGGYFWRKVLIWWESVLQGLDSSGCSLFFQMIF